METTGYAAVNKESAQQSVYVAGMNTTLMVQGTTSDAGKSTLVAGLGRLLARRGLQVAPFKPQNMALNSAVTADGGEIGRAQAVQAVACGVPTSVHMNPILIKPSSDTGAQVIVQGKALGNFEAGQFHKYKAEAMQYVLDSYQRLQKDYAHILVEGAGSPAEINLREGDIANMGFAEAVNCPVVLVTDIDRGGSFAHLIGTLACLSQSEQDRICGFVINRFRGDQSLLQPGIDWLEKRTQKPVLAVVPYLHDFHLEAEDSIQSAQPLAESALHVCVPVFPRISNHTDFDTLRLNPAINLNYVGPESAIPPCDLIILPGTKSVRHDLEHLHRVGWGQSILRHLRYGGKVLGICGGYQMLGHRVADPQGIESTPGTTDGLGVLDVETLLEPEKVLENVSGHLTLDEALVTGYEIHMGVTTPTGEPLEPFARLTQTDGQTRNDGACSHDDLVRGTYLHGVFDNISAQKALLSWAGAAKAIQPIDYNALCEAEIERLADTLESCFDLSKLPTAAYHSP